jgi:hypothetical protein
MCTNNTNTLISESRNKPYKLLQFYLNAEETSERVSLLFDDFLKKSKHEPLLDKVFSFHIFRNDGLNLLLNDLPDELREDIDIKRSMFDYFDFIFSNLFFRGSGNTNPIHEKIDNDFYYVLLPNVIDKIEFPMLIDSELRQSLNIKNRDKYSLDKKNRLSIYYTLIKDMYHVILEDYLNKYHNYPTKQRLLGLVKPYRSQFLKLLENQFNLYNQKIKSNKTKEGMLIVYRGYDISDDENVIVDRKIRTQDSSKSFSFTTSIDVAVMYSTYKLDEVTDDESITFEDRVNLTSSMFNIENYRNKENRKFIVSKYEVDLKDVICTPLQNTITEYEVFAYPEKAKLIRYQIVNSSSTN